jgi:protein ImuB
MFCCIYASGNLPIILHCAQQFSPLIETHADMVVFDARGLGGLHGPPESLAASVERTVGIPANIAIAANIDAAIHAARGFQGVTVIEAGKEAATLASLPINLLDGSADVALSLDLWGIRTFGQFAALPPIGVAARLGDEGLHLQRLAAGAGFRRLQVAKEALQFEAEMDLDTPIELLESLCFVFQRLLDDLLARLARASLSTNEICVRLSLEGAPDHVTTLRLPVSRVPCGQLRADCLCKRLPEMSLPRSFHVRLAEQPAHGFLQPRGAHQRCPASWSSCASCSRERVGLELHD